MPTKELDLEFTELKSILKQAEQDREDLTKYGYDAPTAEEMKYQKDLKEHINIVHQAVTNARKRASNMMKKKRMLTDGTKNENERKKQLVEDQQNHLDQVLNNMEQDRKQRKKKRVSIFKRRSEHRVMEALYLKERASRNGAL